MSIQRHMVEHVRLSRKAALAQARMFAKEWRLERHDGHRNREAVDMHYEMVIRWYREDARDALKVLRQMRAVA